MDEKGPPIPAVIPPDEVSVFVDPDGSVTFSDLPSDLAQVAAALAGQGQTDLCPVYLDGPCVVLLDQRELPAREEWLRLGRPEEVADAIRDMAVRGAPAIGIAAAAGIALAAEQASDEPEQFFAKLARTCEMFLSARPTAVNLAWAVQRMQSVISRNRAARPSEVRVALRAEAEAILAEDVAMNRAIGRHGAELLPDGATVMTHCNAGALATGGYGTALGILRAAREAGKAIRVVACETRPRLQGARLTVWELTREGFDVTLITDGAAASLMAKGLITCVVVGADRIAANGDTANKIGTYAHAVAALHHGIPFYVAAPSSTLDPSIADGSLIPIEERSAAEVLSIAGVQVAATPTRVLNPAFDVTPWRLITAIVTEQGIHRPGPQGYHFTRV